MPVPHAKLVLLLGYLTLVGACSSGGDDNGAVSVATQAGAGGNLIPDQRSVVPESRTQFRVQTEPGYRIASVTGCSGTLNDSSYTTEPITNQCTVRAQFELEQYDISTQVSGGEIEPGAANPTHGESVEFTLTPAEGYRLEGTEASGCDGERQGDRYITGPITDNCHIQINFGSATVSLGGRITPVDGTVVDSDINDAFSELIDNSSFNDPQAIPSLGRVQGFVVYPEAGTGGNPALEHFAETNDQHDFFRTYLQEGQVIRLQISDFQEDDNVSVDLDLYLFDPEGELITGSAGLSWEETLIVPESGEYVLDVEAFAGQSKYTLQLLPQGTATAGVQPSTGMNFVPDEMIVKLAPGAQAPSVKTKAITGEAANLSQLKPGRAGLVKIERSLGTVGILRNGAASKRSRAMEQLRQRNPQAYRKIMTLRDIKMMGRRPDVVYAEPNYILQALRTPNDPGYSDQWHYPIIGLPDAWDITIGQEQGQEPVIVAVVDSGVYLDHPDLQGQLISGYDFISDPESALDGDGIDGNPDDPGDSDVPGESSWHGTHVAGTIAAQSNNNNGVAGISWGAQIMPLRALGEGGSGTTYDIGQSVLYAARLENNSNTLPQRRADIINLSLGGPDPSSYSRDIYEEARQQGVILVAASGNENTSVPSYPAAYDGVFSVAATCVTATGSSERAPYSNYGNHIELAAPGGHLDPSDDSACQLEGILSTLAEKDDEGTRSPRYAFYEGTSMASPHVAGVFALMKAAYPDLDPEMLERLLVNNELTDDLGDAGRDDNFGYGLINADNAVQAAADLAAGGQPPEWPPLVTADPERVYLYDDSEATITLINEGGGSPSVTGQNTDADWLTLEAQAIDDSGLGDYRLIPDLSELGDGFYQAQVTFTLDTGSEVTVPVYLQLGGAASEGELAPLYVLLLDAETDEVVQQTLAQPEGAEALYRFEEVALGRYTIQAGSDIDVDDVICQAAEACGAYPELEDQRVIQVEGQNLLDLDFIARIVSQAGATDDTAPLSRSKPASAEDPPEKVPSP